MKLRMHIIPLIFLAISFAIAIHCGSSETKEAPEKVVPVKLTTVQPQKVAIPIYASGMLFSKQQIRLSFKTGGIIRDIQVQEGSFVRTGKILAQLALDEIESRVQQAQSGLDKAQRDYDRAQNLYDDGVVTLEQMQNVETQLTLAKSNFQIAEFNLDHSTIKAPSDGHILKQLAEANELVGPGQPVFYFGAGKEEWLVRAGVSDRDIIKLQMNDKATVQFDAYPNRPFIGKVTEIAQAADPQNGTFEVEIVLDAEGKALAAGFGARATITPSRLEELVLVPASAVVEANGNRGAVYTVKADTARKVQVELGPVIGERIAVLSGLDGLSFVVSMGAPYLKAGDKVLIKN